MARAKTHKLRDNQLIPLPPNAMMFPIMCNNAPRKGPTFFPISASASANCPVAFAPILTAFRAMATIAVIKLAAIIATPDNANKFSLAHFLKRSKRVRSFVAISSSRIS